MSSFSVMAFFSGSLKWFPCLVLTFFFASVAQSKTLHIYLVCGQSNAGGHADGTFLSEKLKVQPKVPFYYASPFSGNSGIYSTLTYGSYLSTSYGPEITFGHDLQSFLEASTTEDKIGVIKYASGATSLWQDWKANGTKEKSADGSVYQVFQSVVTAGLAAFQNDPSLAGYTKRIEGILWVQGEQDISLQAGVPAVPSATNYASNLTTFIMDVRATLGAEVPFYFSEISLNQSYYGSTSEMATARDIVRSAQAAVAAGMDKAYLIDTDSPDFSVFDDKVHYDGGGQQTLGSAFARRVRQDLVLTPPARPGLQIAGKTHRLTEKRKVTIFGSTTGAVARVEYQVGARKALRHAIGTKRWHFAVNVPRGKTVVKVFARGAARDSVPGKVTITRK